MLHHLHILILLLVALSASASSPNPTKQCPSNLTLLIGSATDVVWDPTSKGKGITKLRFQSNRLTTQTIIPKTITDQNPTYIAVHPPYIYAVKNAVQNGTLTQLSLTNGQYTNKTIQLRDGSSSHLSIISSPSPSLPTIILIANYGFGQGQSSIDSILQNQDGSLTPADRYTFPKNLASMANPIRQEAPHPHMVFPYQRGVLVPDLGSDRLWYFKVAVNGKLELLSELKSKPGDGPRHVALHKKSDTVYILNELSLSLDVVRRGQCGSTIRYGDKFLLCRRWNLLTKNRIPEGENKAAAIRISNDQKFLYASVRFTDLDGVIVVFKLDCNGEIERRVGVYSSQGIRPRDFFIVDRVLVNGVCASFVAVANVDSNEVVFIRRNVKTGALDNKVAFKETVASPNSVIVQ